MFRRLFGGKPSNSQAVLAALRELRSNVERLNIPVIMDDQDAGYDMAVDEALALIDEAINKAASENDVDYSGGI